MTGSTPTCPGWREDGSFNTDACSRAYRDDEHGPAETECKCTTWCGDPGDGAGCCYCNHSDVYEPCPAVGYGCGMNAAPYVWRGVLHTPDSPRCDCCTDEQWAAASTPSAAALALMGSAS